MRLGRSLVLGTVVAMAALGAMDTHWTGMLLVAPGLGLCFSVMVALVDSDFPQEPGSRRAVVYAFVSGCLLVPFANALVMLGTVGGAVLVALFVLGPLLLAESVPAAGPVEQPDVPGIRDRLPALSTPQLLDEWAATEQLLDLPRYHAAAVEVRALLLDELARRDPDGVAAWLAAGCDSPAAFIRSAGDPAG